MLKQLDRLKLLYDYLQKSQADANTLLSFLLANNAEISLRQLQRDLKDVEAYFLKSSEKLVATLQSRKKIYQITISDAPINLTQEIINTWQLVELSGNVPLLQDRVKNIQDNANIFNNIPQLTTGNRIEMNSKGLISTNFYEIKKNHNFSKTVDVLMKAIRQNSYVKIGKISDDFTVDNISGEKTKVTFAPIAIIYHRGDFFIGGMEKNEICFYEIDQFFDIEISNRRFNGKDYLKKLEKERNNRFGISKNINDEVYDIKLEFTNITGALIKKYFWHESQKFYQKSSNDNIIMTLKCGINRELVGWIFQWMYNVRILEPTVLKEKYASAKKKMNKIDEKSAFKYDNIFEP